VGYIRVSKMLTEKKLKKPLKRKYKGKARQKRVRVDKISPEVQKERIKSEIARRDWEQGPIFSDLDVPSKAWGRRKDFKDLLAELQPGDVLITVEGSRIARDVYMMSKIYKEEFEDRGIELLALNEQWDTTTAMGKGAMMMNWVWAQIEGDQISERVCYAKETSRDLGHWQGGIAPMGLDYDERPGYLVIIKIEAEIIRAIFEAVAEGISYNSIAMCLNNWKIRGPNQGRLNASSIYRLVRNPTYIGCGEWDGDCSNS
jgi:site-specific DNA recombinase